MIIKQLNDHPYNRNDGDWYHFIPDDDDPDEFNGDVVLDFRLELVYDF